MQTREGIVVDVAVHHRVQCLNKVEPICGVCEEIPPVLEQLLLSWIMVRQGAVLFCHCPSR